MALFTFRLKIEMTIHICLINFIVFARNGWSLGQPASTFQFFAHVCGSDAIVTSEHNNGRSEWKLGNHLLRVRTDNRFGMRHCLRYDARIVWHRSAFIGELSQATPIRVWHCTLHKFTKSKKCQYLQSLARKPIPLGCTKFCQSGGSWIRRCESTSA